MEEENKEKNKCIIDGCSETARWKGLCGKCYHAAKTLITKNGLSWEYLAKLGLAVIPDSPFMKSYNEAIKKENTQATDSVLDDEKEKRTLDFPDRVL